MIRRRCRRRKGQSAVEFAIVFAGIILPITAMLISLAQMVWVWHGVTELTRDGARYAATHCYQEGSNVVGYMRENVPPIPDRDQFASGGADIVVSYLGRNAETGDLEEFACEGSPCSRECVPDVVSVTVRGYEFRGFFAFFGLPPIALPNFQTTVAMESAGCSPDSEDCTP